MTEADTRLRAAARHARLAGRTQPGAAPRRRVRGGRRRRSAARRSPPTSSGARPRPPSIGSSAIRRRTAAGCTSTTPTRTRSVRVQRGAPRRGDDGPLPGRRGRTARGVALRRPGYRMGARQAPQPRWLGRDRRRRSEVTTGATALLVAGLVIRREATGDPRYDDVLADSGASCSLRPSRRVRCSPQTTRRAGRRWPASTPSTTPGRPTGLWRASTEPSPARVGARPRTASAPTWRRRATRSRITGRRSPITGPPTACPRPWSSPSAAARRSPSTRWTTRAARPSCSASRPGGSASAPGRGAGWCGAATRPVAAGTAWSARPSPGGGSPRGRAPARRPARPDRRTRHLHRRTGRGRAIRRGGCRRRRPAGAGGGRVVPRRRDPHGRSATRTGRPVANHPDRRGGDASSGRLVRPGDDAIGLVVGRRAGAGAQPRPGRVRGSSRWALAADRRRRGRARRGDRRARRVRRRGRGRPAARGARCQRALVPHRRRDRGRDWRAPPTCSGDHPRPNPRSPAGAPR